MLFPRRFVLTALAVLLALGTALPATGAEVTLKGKPIALRGQVPAVGDKAPDFTALDGDFQPVSLSDFRGRPVLISAVPSLDTPVCSLQTRHFNAALAELPKDLVVMTISRDLPFAQQRFCGKEDITDMVVVSDAARQEFGEAYGVLFAARGLLARSVFLVDAEGIIRYVQIVPELTTEPDYDAALAAVKALFP